jgi:predicted glutamine amidotransferase
MTNDPARVASALHPAREMLVVPATTSIDSWGIGFYQAEPLLQRRPKSPSEAIDFYTIAKDLRTDTIIAHVREGTVGQPKNENTHPFRFRQWMFAHHGTLPAWQQIQEPVLASLPPFIARNIRGETDSELLFHLFLANLHEDGRLEDQTVPAKAVVDALRETMRRIESLAGADVARAAECALAVTNGRVMVCSRHGRNVYLHKTRGIYDDPVLREPGNGRPPKKVDLEHLRAVLMIADMDETPSGPGWESLPDHSFAAVSRELDVEILPIY